MRTNIEIDDELMSQAMAVTGAATKKAAVEEALQLMVKIKNQSSIRELWGLAQWVAPEDDWFAPDPLEGEGVKVSTATQSSCQDSEGAQIELKQHGNR